MQSAPINFISTLTKYLLQGQAIVIYFSKNGNGGEGVVKTNMHFYDILKWTGV